MSLSPSPGKPSPGMSSRIHKNNLAEICACHRTQFTADQNRPFIRIFCGYISMCNLTVFVSARGAPITESPSRVHRIAEKT